MPDKITYIRFTQDSNDSPHFGIISDEGIIQLEEAPWHNIRKTDKLLKSNQVTFLLPVQPTKIICVGLNYHAHVGASQSATKAPDQPMLFFKPPSSLIGPNDKIVYPDQTQRVDYEAELGIVMGRKTKHVSENAALDHVLGFTCVNDVTARDLQKIDGQWGRAKGFDTFCPVGPWIVGGIDSANLKIEGILNGQVKQSGNTSDMIFDIPFLISYISSIMTLEPGDLISTGTPAGIEPMKPGDIIEVRIDQIGSIRNSVVKHDD